MRQDLAGGDLPVAGIAIARWRIGRQEGRLVDITAQGLVQVEETPADELHDAVGEHGFAEGRGFEDRIQGHRLAGVRILRPEGALPGDRPAFDQGDGGPGNERLGQERGHLLLDPPGGFFRPRELSGDRPFRGAGDGREKNEGDSAGDEPPGFGHGRLLRQSTRGIRRLANRIRPRFPVRCPGPERSMRHSHERSDGAARAYPGYRRGH